MTVRLEETITAADLLPLGASVVVHFNGSIVGRSEFPHGESYLIEHERKGRSVREWVVADKVSEIGSTPTGTEH